MRLFFAVLLVLAGGLQIVGAVVSLLFFPSDNVSPVIGGLLFGAALLAWGLWIVRRRASVHDRAEPSREPDIGWKKATMLGLTAFWLVSAIPGGVLAFTTVFMFDAPGSDANPLTIALAASFWSFPGLAVLAPVGSWVARFGGSARVATAVDSRIEEFFVVPADGEPPPQPLQRGRKPR